MKKFRNWRLFLKFFSLKHGKYKVGNQKGTACDIVLMGPSICDQHAIIRVSKDRLKVSVERNSEKAKILINGSPLIGSLDLHHNDRILFGTTQLYAFANPIEAKKLGIADRPATWETAQEEIAGHSGFDMEHDPSKSDADLILQEELLDVIPAVEQSNAISEALDKMTKFELVLVPPETGNGNSRKKSSQIFVRVRNFSNGLQYEWPKEKFMNRFYLMQDMYESFEEGENWKVVEGEDPFAESLEDPVQIGTSSLYLKSLAYLIEMKSQLEIIDLRGNEVGLLNVELVPCDEQGHAFTEYSYLWIDNPQDLIGKDLHFYFKILSARGLPPRFTDIQCRYKVRIRDHFCSKFFNS